ncbi:hypothetical protein NBRC116188_14380 [Oceaniserpentilla sp. 4NH20-0058]|uniref:hypothetical protein n=1 Tax=Oceaniserpentilla sp. 4NH20-0058 TaxID=3127660 RepID=UPI003109779F
MIRSLSLAATLLAAQFSYATTAQIQVAERDCSNTTLTKLFNGQSRWTSAYSAINRENSDDSKCTQSDVQTWLTTLQASCTTYFDIISITPITKGYAQIAYHDYAYASTDENGRAGGYGYSYTDRLIMTYRCL